MAKRRSAVDEVLGSDSPISLKVKAQKEAARRAREQDGIEDAPATRAAVPPAETPEPPRTTVSRRAPANRSVGRGGQRHGKAEPRGKNKKQKPAKRIPVTGNEGDVWEGVCRTLGDCVDAKVTFAAASRAIWAMVVDVQDDLGRFDAPQLEKPAHADVVGNAEFERQLKEFLLEVLVKSKKR